ncbi:SIS domain protein [Desulfitobacterium hafniense DP7]|uniref:SIS domain protein n=1 Tax=Desulfitobacterium hafniense DP7 TaxID=537010 RepID=G9XVX3_DESHA|nr:SIS domain-containing protein [Desulfitobacterium hafniense]EHL04236.1 SIS domain protein [Desulfitobacterium hafniense DP7]
MTNYFKKLLVSINTSIEVLDYSMFERLLSDVVDAERRGRKIVVTGLGKNVPICEKFVGTMTSLGLSANFMHSNTAAHGDLGMVRNGDVVIILTKSGRTAESVYLYDLLKERDITVWLLTFGKDSPLARAVPHVLALELDHEGDAWDIVPNNSTTIYLIILQAIAICAAERLEVTLSQFARNHPGGHIGSRLRDE